MLPTMTTMRQLPRREDIAAERTWNKADVYPSDEAWEDAMPAAKLWYDKAKKHFYLLISLEVETPDPTPDQFGQVGGSGIWRPLPLPPTVRSSIPESR
jgi:hypothetical protein